jgi:hypothetical protein
VAVRRSAVAAAFCVLVLALASGAGAAVRLPARIGFTAERDATFNTVGETGFDAGVWGCWRATTRAT